jgi:hypothetical protein
MIVWMTDPRRLMSSSIAPYGLLEILGHND